ncbi:hypothetical protein L7F22_030574 [Adiantum nelumboides]|nr:hypothetical protein [Adiantum nelumboides]
MVPYFMVNMVHENDEAETTPKHPMKENIAKVWKEELEPTYEEEYHDSLEHFNRDDDVDNALTIKVSKRKTKANVSRSFPIKGVADVPVELHGYTDLDWAGSATDQRSTSGFMFTLGSAATTWSSKKQPTVALSSIEAEYRGAAVAACEVAWLRKLFMDLRMQVDREVVIYCDNLSSIQLARNPIFHAWTKHIEVHYHFVQDQVLAGDIDLVYVNTEEQVLDHCKKLPGGIDKKVKIWLENNEGTSLQPLCLDNVGANQKSGQNALLFGSTSLVSASFISQQLKIEVEQILDSKRDALKVLNTTLDNVIVELQDKNQNMWKIQGTSSVAAVLQGKLQELQILRSSMKGAIDTDPDFLVIEGKMAALTSTLTALGADACSSNIRDEVDRLKVCVDQVKARFLLVW